jgi:hypothetical protein
VRLGADVDPTFFGVEEIMRGHCWKPLYEQHYPNLNDFNGQQATPSSVPLMQSAQNACPSSHSWTLAVKSIFNEIHRE